MKFSIKAVVLAACFSTQFSHAQILSVDINGAARSDTTAPGFTAWNITAGTGTASQSFTNFVYTYDPDTGLPISTNIGTVIACQLAQTFPAPSSTVFLKADYSNKDGNTTSTDPNTGWRLSMDGARVHWKDDGASIDMPYTNGGAFSLTISGLSAGVHTITTYHNDYFAKLPLTAWHAGNVMSKCIVSVNGTPVYTNAPTFYATNDSKCGFAFFTITNSFDGQSVVLNFDPDHSSVLDFVILNGFEIDRQAPPGTLATDVFPLPGDEHVFANNDLPLPGTANAGYLTLQWQPAGFAISNILYFGTNPVAVANATIASPEFKQLSAAAANGGTNTFEVANLNSALTYYWRVDQLDVDNGVTNLTTGTVWKFRTRHLAFPTAEGYGRFSRGGRGGVVIEVNNLNDSGPGSYRAAVQASGPRTVVFKVSGLIRLNSPCVIGNGYLTVAGQTAPGEGICLANWRAGMSSCNDVIMRFMRMRLGDASHQAMDGIGLGNSAHSIIDHTSISWTMDEATSSRQSGKVGSESAMITFQHNIVSEPLQHSYHYNDSERAATGCTECFQAHAFAGSISGEIGSYHHNLIAHSTDRNWSLAGGLDQSQHYAGSLDIRNNVVYNWTSRTTDGGVARCDYVNNFYKSYSSNPSAKYVLKLDTLVPAWGTEAYYMAGNVMTGVSGQANLYPDNWANGGFQNGAIVQAQVQTNAEIFPSYVDTQSASNAYEVVVSDSGCNLPVPDLIDVRVVGEVIDRTVHYMGTNGPNYTIDGVLQDARGPNSPGILDAQTDVKDYTNNPAAPNYSPNAPWGPYNTFNVPTDTDHDGLPDWWERIKGLNTNSLAGDFSDANVDMVGDGYSELERYLGWLAKPHYDGTNGTTMSVDLNQFTRGFTNGNPTYAVFNASGGTVNLSGRTAQFTPNTGVEALGSFYFKVTDSGGFSYTNFVNVHILSDGSTAAIPSAPMGLNATAGDTQVSLSWNSVVGATSYVIKRSTTSGGGYVNVVTNASTSYLDSGLANGTTYYYVVMARNTVGDSGDSAEASAIPQLALPAVPTGLNAAAGNAQVSLNWGAASGATAYIVKRSTISGSGYINIATNATTVYVDAGVTNGTTYYFVVSAVNATGESANSIQASATPQIPAPTGLAAAAGNNQIVLNWNTSVGATNYVLKRSTADGSVYVNIATNATTTYTDAGLVAGVTYYYVVSALGASGESANSSQVSAVPTSAGGSSNPFVYETFIEYAVGTPLVNSSLTGGIGFGNNYGSKPGGANGNPIVAAGLNYGNLQTVGNAVYLGATNANQFLLQHNFNGSGGTKTFATLAATNSGTLWLSFLFYNPSYDTSGFYRESSFDFVIGANTTDPKGGAVLGGVGMPNTSATVTPTWSQFTSRTENGSTTSTVQSGLSIFSPGVQLVVLRIDVNAAANATDPVYLWINPAIGGAEPDIATALLTNTTMNLDAVNGYRLVANGISGANTNASFTVDEVRLGSTFAAVTPTTGGANTAPVLSVINNRTINVGVNLLITNSATDNDAPAQTLTYSLPIAPTNAAIGGSSGILNWRPLVTQAGTTNPFSVVVTDSGSPSLSATQNFNVMVNPLALPGVAGSISNGQINLSVSGQLGPDYALQGSTNLIDWNTLAITNPAAMPFNWNTNAGTLPAYYYRVKVGPPLP